MSIPADTVTSRYTYEEMTNFTVVRLKTLLQIFGVQGLPAVSRAVMSTIIVGKMRERDQAAELDAQQNNLRRLEDAIRTKDEKIGEQGARLARVEKQLSDARKALVPWLAKKAAEAVVERKEADERDEKEIEEELLGSAESLPVPENTPTPDNNTPAAPSRPNKRQRSTPPPRENPAEDEGSVDAEPPTNRQRMDPEYVDVSSTPAAITPEFAPPITAPLRSNRPRSSLTASLDPILSDTPHADPAPFGYDSLGNIRKFPADLSRHCNGSLRERATVRGAVFLLLSLESESSASLASTSSSASSMQSESATGGRYYQECAQLGDEPAAESALRSEVYPYDDDIEMEAVNEYRH